MEYEHYISLDWSQSVMSLARMGRHSSKVEVKEGSSSIRGIKNFLSKYSGSKIFTFEESTPAQWLYTELKEEVDQVIVCDPYRNRLLSEGPKTDRIDAIKLCRLLKADLLKPVFHCTDEWIHRRKLMSVYEDLVKSGVRIKNQRSSIFRSHGKKVVSVSEVELASDRFILESLENQIESYEEQRKIFKKEFSRLSRNDSLIQLLETMPGFGSILAIRFAAIVVDPRRFKRPSHFLSYCGLVRLDRISGGKSYGRKRPRYSHTLKGVIKSATITALTKKNIYQDYYHYLKEKKGYPNHHARHAVARKLALVALGIMREKKKFDPDKVFTV